MLFTQWLPPSPNFFAYLYQKTGEFYAVFQIRWNIQKKLEVFRCRFILSGPTQEVPLTPHRMSGTVWLANSLALFYSFLYLCRGRACLSSWRGKGGGRTQGWRHQNTPGIFLIFPFFVISLPSLLLYAPLLSVPLPLLTLYPSTRFPLPSSFLPLLLTFLTPLLSSCFLFKGKVVRNDFLA